MKNINDAIRIKKQLLKTTTVAELIEALQDQDPEALVVFASDYGDIMHTQQVHLLDGNIVEYPVRECPGYSQSGLALYTKDPDNEEELPRVLVIE